MGYRDSEQERFNKIRENQLRARDPHAKERKVSGKVATRRKKKINKQADFFTESAGGASKKLRGLLIGALLGLIVMIVLPMIVEGDWGVMLGFLAIPALMVLGLLFGASFDWRDDIRNLLK